jgi:hypothetical protein
MPPVQHSSILKKQNNNNKKCYLKCQSLTFQKLMAGGVAQVVEGLSSKHEALSSNSNTTEKRKEKTDSSI